MIEDLIVLGESRLTASGEAFDLSLYLIEQTLNGDIATEVAW